MGLFGNEDKDWGLTGTIPATQFRGDGLGQEVGRQWLRTKGEAVR